MNSDPETMKLAENMLDAIADVAVGHRQSVVAAALTRVCSAIVQQCAEDKRPSDALRASAEYLADMAENCEAGRMQ